MGGRSCAGIRVLGDGDRCEGQSLWVGVQHASDFRGREGVLLTYETSWEDGSV